MGQILSALPVSSCKFDIYLALYKPTFVGKNEQHRIAGFKISSGSTDD
jgi:hypothetical protein